MNRLDLQIIPAQNIPLLLVDENTGQIEGVPANPRFIEVERFEALKNSLKNFPAMLGLRELIVFPLAGRYVVIGGNMRRRAMVELNFEDALCKVLPEDTAPDVLRELIMQDNNAYSETDWKAIQTDWDNTELEDWGIEVQEAWNEDEVDLSGFFEQVPENEKEQVFKIVLEYTEDDYEKVQDALKKKTGTKEEIIFSLLVV
jgi:hypothetical protein